MLIVREDLLGDVIAGTPTAMNYQVAAENGSMYNTPATYSWYLAGLVFDWLKQQGGVVEIEKITKEKPKSYTGI